MNYGFNFNPSFMRNTAPIQMPIYNSIQSQATIPRISSLFRDRTPGVGIANPSKITFSGILNGASKTLGVINQAIPVFYQVKPIWNNAKTMFKVVKGLNSKDSVPSTTAPMNNNIQKNESKSNAPTFFM